MAYDESSPEYAGEDEPRDPLKYYGPGPTPESPLVTIERVVDTRLNRMRTGSQTFLTTSYQYHREGRYVAAFGQVGAYALTRFAVGAAEGLTLPFRPIAIVETGRTVYGLATSAEQRKAFAESVVADPVGFGAEVAGGYFGARVSPLKISRKVAAQAPDEVAPVATVQARGTWSVSGKGGFGKSRGSVVILQRPQVKQIPKIPSYIDPVALTVSTAVGLRHKVQPTAPRPQTVSEAISRQETEERQRQRVTPRIFEPVREREKELSRPIIAPMITPRPVPIPRPVVLPTLIPPGYTPRPIQETIPRIIQIPRPVIITEPVQVQKQRQRVAAVSIPDIGQISLDAPRVRRRPLRKPKKGFDPLKLDIWGELRGYPVATPKEVLKRLGI